MCCPEAVLPTGMDPPIQFNNYFTKQISELASYLTKPGLARHSAVVGDQMVPTKEWKF